MPLDKQRIGFLDLSDPGNVRRFLSPEPPADLMLNRDGTLAVSRNHNATSPIVWDVRKGQPLARLAEDNATCWFSPDGTRLLAAGSSAHRIYETASWKLLQEIPTRATSDRPSYGAWSPDGSMIAVNIERSRILLIDTKTWKPITELTSPDPLQGLNFCFNPDGRYLAVGSLRGRVELWDLQAIQDGVRKLGLRFAWRESSK